MAERALSDLGECLMTRLDIAIFDATNSTKVVESSCTDGWMILVLMIEWLTRSGVLGLLRP